MKDLERRDPRKIIPNGPYCYSGSRNPADDSYKRCPYWGMEGPSDNRYGTCSYLNISDEDDEDSLGLLWDQIKACGINSDYEED